MKKPAPYSKTVAGTLTGLFAAGSLPGAIVHFSTPVESLDSSGPGTTGWDVDGVSGSEFSFYRTSTSSTFPADGYTTTLGSYITTSFSTSSTYSQSVYGLAAGNDIVGRSFRPANLTLGNVVGNPLSTVNQSWRNNNFLFSYGSITATEFTSGVSGYIGFRFGNSDPNLANYGWARITLTETGNMGDAVIHEWAYNSVAGAPITVGAIPEPETAAAGLGALALGAAGLRRWRKRKQQAA